MKAIVNILSMLFACFSIAQSGDFVTVWNLSNPGADGNNSIRFNALGSGPIEFTWKELPDGLSGSGVLPAFGMTRNLTNLPKNAVIELRMSPQHLQAFSIDYGVGRSRLVDVKQWGTAVWTTMENAFRGCDLFTITATDVPNLSRVSSMSQMFEGCTKLNGPANINNWNTSYVSNMSNMFRGALSFNQNIGQWNTSNVINMNRMFFEAKSFNQDISRWNVTKVLDMSFMFQKAVSFNQNLGNWTFNPQVNLGKLLNESGMSCKNYSLTLIGWANNPNTPNGRLLSEEGRTYNFEAIEARKLLIGIKGWRIVGDVQNQHECLSFDD